VGDILLVLRKETREWVNAQDTRSWLKQALLIVGIFGVLMPAMTKQGAWGAVVFLGTVFMPAMMPAAEISDAFAGERERATLETLLATPLSAGAIFVGKVLSRVLYGWVGSLAVFAAGMATVLLKGDQVDLSVGLIAPLLLEAPLISFLVADIGAVISSRARSSRSAAQILQWGLLSGVVGLALLFYFLPVTWREAAWSTAHSVPVWMVSLLVADALCLWGSLRTLRRSRLLRV
jgi:ABC-2 type transport system permease protein